MSLSDIKDDYRISLIGYSFLDVIFTEDRINFINQLNIENNGNNTTEINLKNIDFNKWVNVMDKSNLIKVYKIYRFAFKNESTKNETNWTNQKKEKINKHVLIKTIFGTQPNYTGTLWEIIRDVARLNLESNIVNILFDNNTFYILDKVKLYR